MTQTGFRILLSLSIATIIMNSSVFAGPLDNPAMSCSPVSNQKEQPKTTKADLGKFRKNLVNGLKALKAHKLDLALKFFEQAEVTAPEGPMVKSGIEAFRGRVYLERQQYQKAIDAIAPYILEMETAYSELAIDGIFHPPGMKPLTIKNKTQLKQAKHEIEKNINKANLYVAIAYAGQGNYERAEHMFSEVVPFLRDIKTSHLGKALTHYGKLKFNQKHYPEAEELFVESLKWHKGHTDKDDVQRMLLMDILARTYSQQNLLDDAIDEFEDVLSFQKKYLPKGHPNIGLTLKKMGNVYQRMGDNKRASKVYTEALEILGHAAPVMEESYGADHPDVVTVHESITELQALVSN